VLLAGAAAVIAVVYVVSLYVSPYTRCGRCRGRQQHDDRIWKGAFGLCWACGGSGRKPRLGVRLLRPATYKAIRSGRHKRNY
jgi:hypothetical protein